jgi:protein-tyrosine phosphatase
MAIISAWKPNESYDLVIRHLVGGKCVALPTESTYELVASALHFDAIANAQKSAAAQQTPAIVLGTYANLYDWLPLLSGAASRIIRKQGPGPITLSATGGFSLGLWSRLPEQSRRTIVREGRLAARWPAHRIWEELRSCGLPIISFPIEGAATAAQAARLTEEDCSCIIDGGPTQFGASTTLILADGRRCRLLREGTVTREQIDNLALCRILFVCTGNTCRSPMAAALCVKMLADQLGCAPSELRQHGYRVESAGLAAMPGAQASPDAVRVVADFGGNLSGHCSRMASMEMLLWADYIFPMTASHLDALTPIANIPVPRLLSPLADDVADPIGGTIEDYRTCAEQIIQCLQQRLPELLES